MNDHAWRAQRLADELNARGRGWAYVNPIPLNPTPGSIWTCSEPDVQDRFVDTRRSCFFSQAAPSQSGNPSPAGVATLAPIQEATAMS